MSRSQPRTSRRILVRIRRGLGRIEMAVAGVLLVAQFAASIYYMF